SSWSNRCRSTGVAGRNRVCKKARVRSRAATKHHKAPYAFGVSSLARSVQSFSSGGSFGSEYGSFPGAAGGTRLQTRIVASFIPVLRVLGSVEKVADPTEFGKGRSKRSISLPLAISQMRMVLSYELKVGWTPA